MLDIKEFTDLIKNMEYLNIQIAQVKEELVRLNNRIETVNEIHYKDANPAVNIQNNIATKLALIAKGVIT